MLFDKISYIIEKHEVIYSIRMTNMYAQNVLWINWEVLKRCWITIESLKWLCAHCMPAKKWQSWNVNYYFLTTKFFNNSQSTHLHLPSKLGTSSWNNLNLCSKQFFPFVCIFILCLKMVFVGQITNILYMIWIIIYFRACRLS